MNTKNISNPFSTGGGGVHFEAHIQASFVVLMLTGGYCPCLPCWPIVEIELQGRVSGYNTDDVIVTAEKPGEGRKKKLLCQIKHTIQFTESNKDFKEVIHAAWEDFTSKEFDKNIDSIALVVGALSKTDHQGIMPLLHHAKHTSTPETFYRNINTANFFSEKSRAKLEVIKKLIRSKNSEATEERIYSFLRHFHVLSYDLGYEYGVVLSLLHSHISQYRNNNVKSIWSRILDYVSSSNQSAGTITKENIPEDILDYFKEPAVISIPENLKPAVFTEDVDWDTHQYAPLLIKLSLWGAWNANNEDDIEILGQWLADTEWERKIKEILQFRNSPLQLKNGLWQINQRVDIIRTLAPLIFDDDIDGYLEQCGRVLRELNPAFELEKNERQMASIYGKVMRCSHQSRSAICEGLAYLVKYSSSFTNCSTGKIDAAVSNFIYGLLSNQDWRFWATLDDVLPTIAEISPRYFLDRVDIILRENPATVIELFNQESSGIMGRTYTSGLLWAIEGLVWEEEFFMRSCLLLVELAELDPGGTYANRPINTLISVFLPWFPQTMATKEVQYSFIDVLILENINLAWELLIQMLPNQKTTSVNNHKPSIRMQVPEDWQPDTKDYWEKVSYYAEKVVGIAKTDITKLKFLVSIIIDVPQPAFNDLIEYLKSEDVLALDEKIRTPLWDTLNFVALHEKRTDTDAERLLVIEDTAKQLEPKDVISLNHYLFDYYDHELFEIHGNYEDEAKRIELNRKVAIETIYEFGGLTKILEFSMRVKFPQKVGYFLRELSSGEDDKTLLPVYLSSGEHREFIDGYIKGKYDLAGWSWVDSLSAQSWATKEICDFFLCLPQKFATWERLDKILPNEQSVYWKSDRLYINPYQLENLTDAVQKLIDVDRVDKAIDCLFHEIFNKKIVDVSLCITALKKNNSIDKIDVYHITRLIKYLQEVPDLPSDELLEIEMKYLALLDDHSEAQPVTLEKTMAKDPDFFCEIIKIVYRSKNEQSSPKSKEYNEEFVKLLWSLLFSWKHIPGTTKEGTIDELAFNTWIDEVKRITAKSGHLEAALSTIGSTLAYSPKDQNGLWIDTTVAKALNSKDADALRSGYHSGEVNKRGVHWIDPTGKPEFELAEKYNKKAEELEKAGYIRFAATVKHISNMYRSEGENRLGENE